MGHLVRAWRNLLHDEQNNPDKTKQDRYQAWLKVIAKDAQINEASKLLGEFSAQNWVAKKTN